MAAFLETGYGFGQKFLREKPAIVYGWDDVEGWGGEREDMHETGGGSSRYPDDDDDEPLRRGVGASVVCGGGGASPTATTQCRCAARNPQAKKSCSQSTTKRDRVLRAGRKPRPCRISARSSFCA